MIEHSHILTSKKDEYFLMQHKMDEYLLAEFKPGDTVVQCEKCHRVWLADTWGIKNCCPNDQCHHTKTEPFLKKQNRIQEKKGSRIRIVKNENTGFSTVEKKADHVMKKWDSRLWKIWKNIGKMHNLYFSPLRKTIKAIFTITVIISAALSIVQFRQAESPLNGRNGIFYQKSVMNVWGKAEDSLTEALEKSGHAAEDLIDKGTASMADITVKTGTAVTEGMDTTLLSTSESMAKVPETVTDSVKKQINAIRKMYGGR